MTEAHSRTKRTSLRFAVDNYPLRYKTEFEDGTASLDNISSGGCALSDFNSRVTLHEKILLILVCEEQQIEIGGVVVRVVESGIAVRFTQISEENRQKVVVFFARLLREQKSS